MNIPTPDSRELKTLKDPQTLNECWIEPADFSFIATATTSELIVACSKINQICNRKLNHQETDYIFFDTSFNPITYSTFVLPNNPVKSITDIHIQVLDTFTSIDTQYIQGIPGSGILNILPFPENNSPVAYAPRSHGKYNVWVRYNSGFKINGDTGDTYQEVPEMVKYATALMVKYLKSLQNNDGTVESFSTQTYSQKNSTPKTNSLLLEVQDILKDYIIFNYD